MVFGSLNQTSLMLWNREVETMAKSSEARLRANNKYAKKNVSQVCLKYVTKNNREILEKLNSVPSKADYVRQLILKDLEREKKEANEK